jgi:hypothetical protein
MGYAKVLQSLGFKVQAAAPAPAAATAVPADPAASAGVQVVPGEAGALIDEQKQAELELAAAEQKVAEINQKMADPAVSTPQPTGDNTMDPIVTPAPADATKPVPAPVAAPAPEAAAAPIAPAAAAKPWEGKEGKAEEAAEKKDDKKPEDKKEAAFTIRFAQGKTFNDSYFVAEEKGEFRAAKASRIIPVVVQNKILKCLAATGAPPEDVITPTEIIEQMTGQGVNSLETFDTAVVALEANANLMTKQAGMMAWNEAEVKTEKGNPKEPLMAMQMSEFKAGQKMHPVPSGTSSKTKAFYARLPGSAGGEPTVAINPQSSTNVKDKIDFMRRALEEMKGKVDMAEGKAKAAEEKVGVMEKGNEDKETSGLMESIIQDLIGKKLLTEKDEQAAVAALSKIDRKNLAALASFLKLLGKSEGSAMGGGLPGAKPAIGMEAKPAPFGKPAAPANPFGAEQHPKASMRAVPPTFLNEDEPDMGNGSAFLAKYWDAR